MLNHVESCSRTPPHLQHRNLYRGVNDKHASKPNGESYPCILHLGIPPEKYKGHNHAQKKQRSETLDQYKWPAPVGMKSVHLTPLQRQIGRQAGHFRLRRRVPDPNAHDGNTDSNPLYAAPVGAAVTFVVRSAQVVGAEHLEVCTIEVRVGARSFCYHIPGFHLHRCVVEGEERASYRTRMHSVGVEFLVGWDPTLISIHPRQC
mmetsp:Transcript_26217/g.63577  ORF Transcript_26217/g.63577 Transcript_26217/m.63577 type:complete len:204 (+) Transcript_26217:1004-1615(+)